MINYLLKGFLMPAVMSVGLVGNLLSIRVLRSPNIDMKVLRSPNIDTKVLRSPNIDMKVEIIDIVRIFCWCMWKLLSILELRRHNIIDTIIGWGLSSQ